MEEIQNDSTYKLYTNVFIKFICTLLFSLLISFLTYRLFWSNNKEFIHSVLELITIIIGVATFLIIWYQQETDNSINNILGFGFLAVAILDFAHIHYYNYFILNDGFKGDLTLKYSIVTRFVEVTTLLIFSYFPFSKKYSKHFMIFVTFIVIGLPIYILSFFENKLPILHTDKGLTNTKVFAEFLIIIIAVFTLNKLKNSLGEKYLIRFIYLFLCVAMIIPAETCFALYNDTNSFALILGHYLKISGYYYLYKAVFESVVRYPYGKLRESNERLSEILNAIPMPIHTYDNNNHLDFVNNKFVELLGYPADKLIGLSDNELLSILPKAENKEENTIPYRIKNSKDNTVTAISTYVNGNKEQIKVIINASKINNGILVLMNDIRQEQEIKNLHLQTQTILNAIVVPMMILDANGSITACNNKVCDLLGIAYNDIIGMNKNKFYNILSFEIKEVAGNTQHDKTRDGYIKTLHGNKLEIREHFDHILNIDNESIGTIYIIKNITQEKENHLKLINQEKLALLGQMGATIVHETRNFLSTIKGSSQLIDLYSGDEKIKQYARKINASTDEVNRIITDFLKLSKPRETELLEVGFNDLVLSLKSILETSSLMEKVDLILDLNYNERYILCDGTQIKQVILNICKNAVEAMTEREKPVLQICTGLKEDTNEIFIKISDNGTGIPKEIINKIGTPFFSTKKNGTGLGLNACYQIIKDHKGKLEIESQLGKGSTFTIILPFINDDLEDII